jgi:hypothetical protein
VHAKQRAHAKCAGLRTAPPEEKSGHVNLREGVVRGAARQARTRMYGAGRSHVSCYPPQCKTAGHQLTSLYFGKDEMMHETWQERETQRPKTVSSDR